MKTLTLIMACLAITVAGCGSSGAPNDAGDGDSDGGSGTEFNVTMSHTFPPITVDVGEESLGLCQAWNLNNEETIYVNKIRQRNEGAWHHSNWFFVPAGTYGPEGTWNCDDFGFRELTAALSGGVFFAQSTQALEEEQIFPEGAVLEIPPNSRIVGDVHLLNIGSERVDSPITFELETIPEEDVEVRLRELNFSYNGLELLPGEETRVTMECDIKAALEAKFRGDAPSFNVQYVLPHYHAFGNYFKLAFVDEEGNEDVIYEINTPTGEPLGGTMNPIVPSKDAKYLRMTCGYVNPTDRIWNYGFADGEMCVFLAYIDIEFRAQGNSYTSTNEFVGMEDGIRMYEGGCDLQWF